MTDKLNVIRLIVNQTRLRYERPEYENRSALSTDHWNPHDDINPIKHYWVVLVSNDTLSHIWGCSCYSLTEKMRLWLRLKGKIFYHVNDIHSLIELTRSCILILLLNTYAARILYTEIKKLRAHCLNSGEYLRRHNCRTRGSDQSKTRSIHSY